VIYLYQTDIIVIKVRHTTNPISGEIMVQTAVFSQLF